MSEFIVKEIELIESANAIRSKMGNELPVMFESDLGFKQAILDIPTGADDSLAGLAYDTMITDYCRLSIISGSKMTCNGRYFITSSSDPVIFVTDYTGEYIGYSALKFGTSPPQGTYSAWGDLLYQFDVTIAETELSYFRMSGRWGAQWASYTQFSNDKYKSINFNKDQLYLDEDGAVKGTKKAEFESFITRFSRLITLNERI